jgi:hypothetical protein
MNPPAPAPLLRLTAAALLGLLMLAVTVGAADKNWQEGIWGEIGTKRQIVDFGPGASPFGRPGSSPSMRALADVHTYVIETDDLHLELRDVVAVGRQSVEVTPGAPVTFAVQKNTVYVRDADGTEHKLRVIKKVKVVR